MRHVSAIFDQDDFSFYVLGVKGAHMFTWSSVMTLEWGGVGLGAQNWGGHLIVQVGQ